MKKFEKYLHRKNALIPKIHQDILKKGAEIPITSILDRNDINQLLDDGYLACENGFCRLPDESTFVAVLTQMPGVTLEMIDWWFWWHAAEPIRYQIWYPAMHFDNKADFGEYYHDNTKTYSERLHLSSHLVTEDVGLGRDKILIDFMHPIAFGFDANQLNLEKETIICAKVGAPDKGVWGTEMCHFVRTTPEGVEMRSRFWIGNKITRMSGFGKTILNAILNRPFVKRNLIPREVGLSMFHHCSQEYHNLAAILPTLYEEERQAD